MRKMGSVKRSKVAGKLERAGAEMIVNEESDNDGALLCVSVLGSSGVGPSMCARVISSSLLSPGGGFVNHILFWNSMTKNGTALEPDSHLMKAIDKVFVRVSPNERTPSFLRLMPHTFL